MSDATYYRENRDALLARARQRKICENCEKSFRLISFPYVNRGGRQVRGTLCYRCTPPGQAFKNYLDFGWADEERVWKPNKRDLREQKDCCRAVGLKSRNGQAGGIGTTVWEATLALVVTCKGFAIEDTTSLENPNGYEVFM